MDFKIGLVTSQQFPSLTKDDELLLIELRAHGMHVEPLIWTDPHVDWASLQLVVVRSPWYGKQRTSKKKVQQLRNIRDYTQKHDEFIKWVESTAKKTKIVNDPNVLIWNSHKRYLLDLESARIPIVPTVICVLDIKGNIFIFPSCRYCWNVEKDTE
jgi:hypothetical protein